MAKINTKWFSEDTDGEFKKVGHNRTVYHGVDAVRCKLHGHEIVTFCRTTRRLTLNTCGYSTKTTRQAMADFVCSIPGLMGNVSFAEQGFWASVNGVVKTTEGSELVFDI